MRIKSRWLRTQWKRFRIWRCHRVWDKLSYKDKKLLTYLGFDPQTKIERGDFDN